MQKVKGHRTNRLNGVLASRYKAAPSEEVFVSGDFTTYIQRFGDSMGCCGAKKLRGILIGNPSSFEPYLDPLYLGSNQERQNSDIYAKWFGKYGSRIKCGGLC